MDRHDGMSGDNSYARDLHRDDYLQDPIPTVTLSNYSARSPSGTLGVPQQHLVSPNVTNDVHLRLSQGQTVDHTAPHAYIPHANIPHVNIPHANIPHANIPHANIPHANIPHANIPHDIPPVGYANQFNTSQPGPPPTLARRPEAGDEFKVYTPVDPFRRRRRTAAVPGSRFTEMSTPPAVNEVSLPTQPVAHVSYLQYYSYTFKDFFVETLARNLYLTLLLRIPSFYFSRVTYIFEEAALTMPEIKHMVAQGFEPTSQVLSYTSQAGINLRKAWEGFIDSLIREWKTLNIVSVLLLSAILAMLQIESAAADPVTRNSALFSLICALMSLLYGCIYIIRFSTMRNTFKALEWAQESQNSKTLIWWNAWVLLAMPAIWLGWSFIVYTACIMTFVWRTSSTPQESTPLSSHAEIAVRITISVLLGLGVLCFALILNTFRHYGSAMSRRFAETIKQRTGQQLNSKPKNRLERSRHTFPGYSSGLGLTPNPLYPANMPSWGPIPVGGSSPSMYWNPHTLAGTRRQNVAHHVASERPPIIPRRGETPYTYGESLPDVDSDRSPPSASRNPGNNERLQSWQGQHSTSDLPPNPAQARNVAPPPILAVSYLVPTAVTNTESLNGPPLSSPSNLALIQHGTHISPTQANYNPGTGHPMEHRSQADAPLNTLERPTGVYVWVPPDNYPQFYDDPSQPPPTRPQRETPYGESLPDVEDEFERSAPSPSRSPSDNEQRQLWGEQYPTSYLPPNRTEPRNVTPPPTPAALHFAPVVAANTGGFPSSEGPSFEPIPQIPQMPERHGSSHPLSPPSTLASIESGSTASPSRLTESNLGRHRMYPYAMSTDYSERSPGLYDSVGRQGSYPGFGDIPSETPPARSRREAPYVEHRSRWSTGPSFSHSPGDGERPHLWGEEYSPSDPPQEVRNITPPPTPAALNLVPAVAANSENPPSPEEMFIGPIPQLDLGIERYGSSDPVSPLSTLASIELGTGNPSRLAQSNLNRLSIQLYQSDAMPTSSPERPIGGYDLEFIPQSPPTEIEATIRGAVSFQMTHSTLTTVNPPAAYQAHGEGAVYVPPRASTPWPTRGSDRPSTENPQHVNRGASTSSGTRHIQSEGSRPSSGSSTNSSRSTRRRRKRLRFLPFDELDSISGIWQNQRYGDSQADGGDEYITAEAGMNHPRRQQIQYIRTIFWRVSPTSSPRPWSTPHILERELETEGDEQEYVNTESYQNMTVHDTDGTPAGAHALQEQNANEAPSQTVSAGPTATSASGLQYTDEREGHRFFGRFDRRELQFREPSEDSLSFSMQPLRVEENQISGVLESDELYVSGEWLAI